jgi:hypothetical protein
MVDLTKPSPEKIKGVFKYWQSQNVVDVQMRAGCP